MTNFVLCPVFAYLSARLISLLIPLEPGYMIGLMIIGSAAGSPMLPKWVKLAKGDLGFSVALMVLPMGTCILYLPLVLPRLHLRHGCGSLESRTASDHDASGPLRKDLGGRWRSCAIESAGAST